MSKLRKIIPNLLLLILVLIVSLVVCEIVAHHYIKMNNIVKKLGYLIKGISGNLSISVFDKDLGWGFKPGSQERRSNSDFNVKYSINSKGNRDKEVSEKKPPAVFRIIALGESTVFGDGINYGKRFTEVIENSLARVEVINMGVWGFGIDQSLLQLKRDGFKFYPDVVVLFAINDFLDRCKYMSRTGDAKPRFVLNPAKDGIILQDIQFIKREFKAELSSNKYLVRKNIKNKKNSMGSNLMLLWNYISKLWVINKPNKDLDKNYWRKVSRNLSNDRKYASVYSKEDFRKLVYFILREYSVICKKQGVDFILVHIDIDGELNLRDICRELNITYLDLSQVLSTASKIKPLTFEIDPHYNNDTHKIIGEYVSDYLEKGYNLQKAKWCTYEYLGKF